jgi:single-strand DNA-binding protein
VTIEGNLTSDPELRYLADGTPVCRLRVAVNTRRKDSDGQYADTEPEFYDVTVWGSAAPNAAESLDKGTAVVAAGDSWTEAYTDRAGERRTKRVLRAHYLGASLRFAAVTVSRTAKRATAADPGQEA